MKAWNSLFFLNNRWPTGFVGWRHRLLSGTVESSVKVKKKNKIKIHSDGAANRGIGPRTSQQKTTASLQVGKRQGKKSLGDGCVYLTRLDFAASRGGKRVVFHIPVFVPDN